MAFSDPRLSSAAPAEVEEEKVMKHDRARLFIWIALLSMAPSARAQAQCPTMPPGTQPAMVPSMYMGAPERIVVYLPPSYASETGRHPVVYWFHGRGDNECTQVGIVKNIQAAIEAGVAAPMIYVFIDGGRGCNFDDTTCAGKMVESYVMKELIPYVDAHYRTVVGPQGRAVEGFSMGAEAVLRYFSTYPDQFCDAVSYAPIGGRALSQHTQEVIRAKGRPALRLIVGTSDAAHLPGTRNYEKMLTAIMLPHEYEEVQGVQHNPFALYGGLDGMVGRRGLQMHTSCFAAAAGGANPTTSDGGAGIEDASAAEAGTPAGSGGTGDGAGTPLVGAGGTSATGGTAGSGGTGGGVAGGGGGNDGTGGMVGSAPRGRSGGGCTVMRHAPANGEGLFAALAALLMFRRIRSRARAAAGGG
jgi:enterochelin esterase-like enzyme